MKAKLVVKDEVNCQFYGIHKKDIEVIIDKTKLMVQGAFHTAKVKLGLWDGKESQFKEDGSTFLFMLPEVLPILDNFGYDIELVDNRHSCPTPSSVDINLFSEYRNNEGNPIYLRPYQLDSINSIIDNLRGIINVATSGGKTLICAGVAKAFEPWFRTLIIVPNDNLVNQTYKEFVGVGLEIGRISSKTKDKKLEWSKQNVVCTWQTLNRHREHLGNFHVVLYDEAHIMGDVMFEVLSNELAHAPVRVGFTGTVPKDKQKKQKVLCHIGGDVLKKVTAKELQDEGYISTLDIYMVPVRHEVNLDGEWETEFSYLCNNKHRLKAIAEFIEDVHATSPIPTLILCHPQFGVRLADKLQLNYIDGTVDPKVREKYYVEYKNTPNYRLIASYDTVGTGISINEITRVIMVDVGKNDTRILQGLGRGLRLDGDTNHLQAFDLYAEMYWEGEERGYSGGKHLSGRKKIYRENQYPFREVEAINVIDPGH